MSASERLRALGPPFDMTNTHSWIDVENNGTMREINSMAALYDALPLIADVVEAAERAMSASWIASDDLMPTCRNKLTPAITALREHLEGGDVT